MAEFENGAYCNFDSSTTKAVAGKDIILAVFDATGTDLLAISGQKGLTINRSADSIEVTSKDTQGGWKSKIAGMKEWYRQNPSLCRNAVDSYTKPGQKQTESGLGTKPQQ